MPVPKPTSGEKQEEFIPRCMEMLIGEGRDQDQAAAICYRQWRNKEDSPADPFDTTTLGVSLKETPHPDSVMVGQYPEFESPPEGVKIPKSTDFYAEWDLTED